MFSGIVEAQSKILKITPARKSCRITVVRPPTFDDIKIGDSIATNGVCLTVETFSKKSIQFCLGAETLKILGSQLKLWEKYPLNLERSMKFGQRVHGNLVTGHVDTAAAVTKTFADGDCWQLQVEVPQQLAKYFWKKGSVCLNGVSLTVNEFISEKKKSLLSVCLIPETMKATNLAAFEVNEKLNIEADYLAKAYIESRATGKSVQKEKK